MTSVSTCTASANTGYTFSAFSGDCTGSTCTLNNVTGAKSVTATFTQNAYAITATANAAASVQVTYTNPDKFIDASAQRGFGGKAGDGAVGKATEPDHVDADNVDVAHAAAPCAGTNR